MKFREGLLLLAIFFAVAFVSWFVVAYYAQERLENERANEALSSLARDQGLTIPDKKH